MFKRLFTQNNLLYLVLILITGIILRVFKIATNYDFAGELGKELLYMRQFSLTHTLPLTGMQTSHPWLSYGPFYYWIMIPVFNLFNGNPFILFWVALAVSIIGLILNYYVIRKIAGNKIALISTLIQSISPLLVWQTRFSKLHVFFFILSPIFMYLLYLIWKGNRRWVFWAGITFGLMFSFHFSQIPLLGVVILLFCIKKNIYKFKDWALFVLGVIIPNVTLIWQDRDLALWLPYRVASVANKNPAGTWAAFLEYLGKNIFWDSRLWIIGLIVFAVVFVDYIIRNKKEVTRDFLPFYLISSISLMFIANVLHGAPPIHYFLPIFTTIPVLYAIYLDKIKFRYLILTVIFLINLFAFFSDPYFYGDASKFVSSVDIVPYSLQNTIASFIVKDAKGSPITIKRVGPYDYFPEQYSQNYKYLVLWKGGKLADKSPDIYTITEDTQKGEVSVQK